MRVIVALSCLSIALAVRRIFSSSWRMDFWVSVRAGEDDADVGGGGEGGAGVGMGVGVHSGVEVEGGVDIVGGWGRWGGEGGEVVGSLRSRSFVSLVGARCEV
ncbi:hypothetical protein DFH27DRAFT_557287 [Peziza echinospora]|nr:hypothetical protein DFH27DRAFT_557287 [Peziza echinospora]